MTKDEILDKAVKLYQRKKDKWHIVGYKCPYCYKHYYTLNRPFYQHINNCDGKRVIDTED